MSASWIDDVARAMASGMSRRDALRRVVGGLAGGVLASLIPRTAAAQVTPRGTQTINVRPSTLEDHECDSNEWQFVITQIAIGQDKPDFITVTWSDSTIDQPLLGQPFQARVGHYTIAKHLTDGVVPVDAETTIYAGWSGNFNLRHGPCGGPPPPPPPPGPPPPNTCSSRGEFCGGKELCCGRLKCCDGLCRRRCLLSPGG